MAFAGEKSQAARPTAQLLGFTERLESLIGRGKRLEGQQSRIGTTNMILGTVASVVGPTYRAMQSAPEAVKTRDVHTWATENPGQTVQARRRSDFAAPIAGSETGSPRSPLSTEFLSRLAAPHKVAWVHPGTRSGIVLARRSW